MGLDFGYKNRIINGNSAINSKEIPIKSRLLFPMDICALRFSKRALADRHLRTRVKDFGKPSKVNALQSSKNQVFLTKSDQHKRHDKTFISLNMRLWLVSAVVIFQIGVAWSCIRRGIECIDYEVITKHMEYEERQYPATVWISAKETGPSLSRAQINLYKKLFRYIQGDNLKGAFINSTTPTRTKVLPCSDDSMCEPTYTMSLLIPSALYNDLFPIPTDVDLFFEREPAKRYVVRSFGGRPSETQWIAEAQKLADLTMKEQGVARDHYYLNWYDPPLQLFNRLNEVWIPKVISKKNGASQKVIRDQNDINEVC